MTAAPVANPDVASFAAGSGGWIGTTGNDTDADGDVLTVMAVGTTGTLGTARLVPGAGAGVYYQTNRSFDYLSVGETALDSFTYTVSDGEGGTATSTVTVTVTGVNQAPVAVADNYRTTAAQPITVNPTANDTDVNRDDVIAITALNVTGTMGSAVLGANNTVTYTPGSAFQFLAAGATAIDHFAYTISDGHGGTATATDTITVTGTWQPPVAAADTASTMATASTTINVLGNDTDPQANARLSVAGLNLAKTKGSVVLNADGTVTYTPGAAYATLAGGATATDTFSYTLADGHGSSAIGNVTVTITGVNTPPVANPDTASFAAGGGGWIGTTGNDTDINGDTLMVTAVGTTGTLGAARLVAGAGAGVYYQTNSAFNALSAGQSALDSLTYTISDGHGGTATSAITITVTGVNQAPVAVADRYTTTASQPIAVSPLANDTDANRGDVIAITALNTVGTMGSAVLGANNIVTYTPGPAFQFLAAGATATDQFAYTIADGHGGTATATDTVTVTGTWLPPLAHADAASTAATASTTINVLANDSDPQANAILSVKALNLTGTNGSAVINANGTITYTPGPAYANLVAGTSSSDSFAYTITDQSGQTSTASVKVTINAGSSTTTSPAALYVATNGNDAWSGRLAQPNAAGTDGPLATLQAAQKAMETSGIKTTYVGGGNYYLQQQLSLTAADSGQSWLAYPGQAPVIHGGQAVIGWVQGSNGIWTAPAPAGAFSGSAAENLYVNGVQETLARYPNAVPSNTVTGGWLYAAASLPGQATTSSFQFNPGDLPAFGSTSGLFVDVYQQNGWQNYVLPVSSINTTTDTITLAGQTALPIGAGSRYYIFDASNQLDAQNEWYYNAATNMISLYAPSGFNGAGVSVGTLGNDVTLSGANNVTISGLTLTDTSSTGNAIYVGNSTGALLKNDTFRNVGHGVVFAGSSAHDTLQNSTISNTGNSGVFITPGTGNLVIQNNTIKNTGTLTVSDAIRFTGSSNDLFTHNYISTVSGSGISGGSAIGASDASYNDVISYNDVESANLQSSDGGGIYLSGLQQNLTGDVIDYNKVNGTSAVGTSATGQFLPTTQLVSYGIYLDDYLSGATVNGNLITNGVGGVQIHSGWNNTVSDNIIANNTGTALVNTVANWQGAGAQADANNLFTGNLISSPAVGAKDAANLGDMNGTEWQKNFYDVAGAGANSFMTLQSGTYVPESFASWQAQGFDAGSVVGASGLTQTGGVYSFAPNSAAAAFGITPFPYSQVGVV
jgi:VCBS repeat-containing protein